MAKLLKPSLNWLLIFIPITVWLHHHEPVKHTWVFVTACISIIPLAGILGHATEHLAAKAGQGIGGLLNATFGNAAELIIAFMALRQGFTDVVKASLTGSIIGNVLLVLGLSAVVGGCKFKTQKFNTTAARSQSTMLILASVALIFPAIFHFLVGNQHQQVERDLSFDISIVLIVTYLCSLLFALKTHKDLFMGDSSDEMHHEGPCKSIKGSLAMLFIATAFIAWMSEMLVGSVEVAAHTFGMSKIFIGVIVVAIVGNAAEHSTAILVAFRNKMDLSLGIAIGSSVQIALFVAPLLVLLSYVVAPVPMDLVFSPLEVFAVFFSTLVCCQIAGDGESNWLEGIQLLSVYVIIGIIFYFMPH